VAQIRRGFAKEDAIYVEVIIKSVPIRSIRPECDLTTRFVVPELTFMFYMGLFAQQLAPSIKLVVFKVPGVGISIATTLGATRFTVQGFNSVVFATLSNEFVQLLSFLGFGFAAMELAFLFFSFPRRLSKGACDFSDFSALFI